MAKLPFYKDLKAKAGYYYNGSKRINSKKDFDRFWERLRDLDDKGIYRFRGSSEAKYMMYTSAQRYWKEQELMRQGIGYHEFIQKLIGYSGNWNRIFSRKKTPRTTSPNASIFTRTSGPMPWPN